MATYSFRIKKGNFQLELSTSDKELLVEQFELWVHSAKKYVHEKKAKECKNLMFSDCYGECKKGYITGIVKPDFSCGKGVKKDSKDLIFIKK